MQILIMRHGAASLYDSCDANRALTMRGRYETWQIGVWLTDLKNITIDHVLVSPYVRAQQTLQTLQNATVSCSHATVDTFPDLIPEGKLNLILRHLQQLYYLNISTILIISHLPLVSHLANNLCPDKNYIPFPTAAIASFSFYNHIENTKFNWLFYPTDYSVLSLSI